MASVERDANYDSVGKILAGTGKTAVFICPTSLYIDVTAIRVAASAGSAGTATIAWYDASEALEYVIVYQGVVGATAPLEIELKPLHIEVDDEIRVTGAAAQHVIVSMLRTSRQNR